MAKLRVLHVTKRYPPYVGGIETVCHDLCAALKNEYDQKVICFNTEKETAQEEYEGIDVVRVGISFTVVSQPISFKYKKEIYKAVREFKPDIIHFDYPNPLASHYLLKAMKKYHFSGKFQLFWHMDIIKQKMIEPFFRREILKMLKLSDQIIVTSPNYLENTTYLPKYADKNKVVVLPLRVGEERLNITEEEKKKAEQIRKENGDKTIGFFFGRHVPYKGIEYLVEANKYLNQNNFTIYLGGKGPLTDSLKEAAKDMPNIKFLGRLSDEEINAYLLACDLFLFPSITRNEAFGISLAEGLWFGKPAVTFTISGSGVNFVSLKDITGLEVANRDSKAYAEAMTKLSKDKELYSMLAKGAHERAVAFFSKDEFERNVKNIYGELKL